VLALAVVSAVLLVAGAVTVPLLMRGGSDGAGTDGTGTGTDDDAEAPTLADVRVFEQPTTRHVSGEVDYDQAPPTGGDHDPAWLECGVYDVPVREENAVHSLEHGTVWVAYEPGVDEDSIDALAEALPAESILSPYDGLRVPVVVTVWGRQLALTGAQDPRLALFLAEYADGNTAPEPFASCAGGVRRTDDSNDDDSTSV